MSRAVARSGLLVALVGLVAVAGAWLAARDGGDRPPAGTTTVVTPLGDLVGTADTNRALAPRPCRLVSAADREALVAPGSSDGSTTDLVAVPVVDVVASRCTIRSGDARATVAVGSALDVLDRRVLTAGDDPGALERSGAPHAVSTERTVLGDDGGGRAVTVWRSPAGPWVVVEVAGPAATDADPGRLAALAGRVLRSLPR